MTQFKEDMSGIVSSSVCSDTLDEAPRAYKQTALIQSAIARSVRIEKRLRPILNVKALD
jgi:hypothetical protein